MATDLQATTNLLNKVIEKIEAKNKSVPIAVTAVAIAVFAVFFSGLISAMGLLFTIQANSKVDQQNQTIERLSDDVDTYRFQISLLHADLEAHGYEIPEKEEDE